MVIGPKQHESSAPAQQTRSSAPEQQIGHASGPSNNRSSGPDRRHLAQVRQRSRSHARADRHIARADETRVGKRPPPCTDGPIAAKLEANSKPTRIGTTEAPKAIGTIGPTRQHTKERHKRHAKGAETAHADARSGKRADDARSGGAKKSEMEGGRWRRRA